jgi:hypothetical protein
VQAEVAALKAEKAQVASHRSAQQAETASQLQVAAKRIVALEAEVKAAVARCEANNDDAKMQAVALEQQLKASQAGHSNDLLAFQKFHAEEVARLEAEARLQKDKAIAQFQNVRFVCADAGLCAVQKLQSDCRAIHQLEHSGPVAH